MVDRAHRDRRRGAPSPASGCRAREATAFGVHRDRRGRQQIAEFLEKPADPPSVPDDPDVAYASMGNYVFTTDALIEALQGRRRGRATPMHDMGGDIIPCFVERGHGARLRLRPQRGARRDRPGPRLLARRRHDRRLLRRAHGSVSVQPIFNLYNRDWPILHRHGAAAAGQVRRGRHRPGLDDRRRARSSPARRVRRSVICRRRADRRRRRGRGLGDHARRADRPGCGGARRASWTRTWWCPTARKVGVDLDRDRERYTVSQGGMVVLGKGITACRLRDVLTRPAGPRPAAAG